MGSSCIVNGGATKAMDTQTRVYAALLGWFVGDGFASQTDGMESEKVQELCNGSLTEVYTLEQERSLSGMTSDVSDLCVLLGMSVLSNKAYDRDHAKAAYRKYCREAGEDGELVGKLLEDAPSNSDQTRSLSRVPIVGLLGFLFGERIQQKAAVEEAGMFSSDDVCTQSSLLISQAFALVFKDEAEDVPSLVRMLDKYASRQGLGDTAYLHTSKMPHGTTKQTYATVMLLQTVFAMLHAQTTFEEGISTIAMNGGNARLTCALYGALKAALDGPSCISERWIDEIFPSPALETMIKKQTLYKRETIKIEKLAASLAKDLLQL